MVDSKPESSTELCEVCQEPLDEEHAVYAGEVMRVHEECRPSNNVDTTDHPAFPPFQEDAL